MLKYKPVKYMGYRIEFRTQRAGKRLIWVHTYIPEKKKEVGTGGATRAVALKGAKKAIAFWVGYGYWKDKR